MVVSTNRYTDAKEKLRGLRSKAGQGRTVVLIKNTYTLIPTYHLKFMPVNYLEGYFRDILNVRYTQKCYIV
jgi:hypothetical protein